MPVPGFLGVVGARWRDDDEGAGASSATAPWADGAIIGSELEQRASELASSLTTSRRVVEGRDTHRLERREWTGRERARVLSSTGLHPVCSAGQTSAA